MHYKTSIIQSLGILNRLKSASALPGCPETEDRYSLFILVTMVHGKRRTPLNLSQLVEYFFFVTCSFRLHTAKSVQEKNIKKIPRRFISQVFGPKFSTKWKLFLSLAFELKIKQNRSSTNDKYFFSSIQTQYYLFPAAPVTQ